MSKNPFASFPLRKKKKAKKKAEDIFSATDHDDALSVKSNTTNKTGWLNC